MDDAVAKALNAARSYYDRSMDLGALSPNVEDVRNQRGRWNAAAIQAINDRYMPRINPNKPGIDDAVPSRGRGMSPEAIGIEDLFTRTPTSNEVRMWRAQEGVPIEYIPDSEKTPVTQYSSGLSLPMPFQETRTPGMAHGGEVEAALHAVRHHLAGGGFLSDLFSGPDYLSTGEAASPTNWGDPELASDFFKADRALRLAREAQAKEPDRDVPLPPRRPVAETAPRPTVAAPPPAPAPAPMAAPVNIPYVVPTQLMRMTGENTSPLHLTERPGFGQSLTESDPSRANPSLMRADTTPEIGGRELQTYTLPEAALARPGQRAEINRAVSLAQNLAPAQPEVIPTAAEALAAVEKLHNVGVYSGAELDKAGEILAAHNRAKMDNIPVEEALRLIRAEGPPMVNQGMPREERPAVRPMAYTATPAAAPAVSAIDQATGKLTARVAEEPNAVPLTAKQGDLIARTIAAETSGKSPEEAQAIASVILNRIRSGEYGSSPEAVLFAKRQFEPWMNPAGSNYPLKISPTGQRYLDAQAALEAALSGEDITGGATHFWGPKAQEALGRNPPSWSYKAPGVDIGETRFHKLERAEGGEVDDALRVVREHHADGEAVGPTMHQRMRETVASIDPERAKDQPVMDPATTGEAWDRARRNYQNFPVQEGEAVARPLELGARDVIGGAIAGGAREPGAQFRRGVADLLVGSTGLPDSGTLGFGVADAPMITGIPLTLADMAHDIGQGDYTSTAMGAALPAAFYARGPLGAAGRRAVEIAKEYAKPAAAAATGVAGATVAPDEAEAAKLSKAFNIIRTAERPVSSRVVSQAGEHGFFQPQSARERDPRLWHPISNTVLSRPLGEMTAEYQLTSGIPERKFIKPEDLEGASLIPALGDRTMGGGLLRGVNDISFKNPIKMQAGHSFMYGPASTGPDRAIWASDPGVITILSNKAKAASEAGFDPYLSYVAMGSRSGDYSHHMTDALREMFAKAKVKKDVVDEFDRQMRENTANKWAAYADWPGLKSKNLEEYLYSTGPGKARTKMAELMGQGQFQKAGMPEVGAARFAITDPELLHAADYSAGRTIARLDPMGRKITEPAVPHKTYKHQLAAHPEEGYVGGFEYDIPFEVMNKEFIDSVIAKDAAKAANPSQLAYTYRMNMPRVDFTPQVVDRLSKFLEMKKMGLIP